MYIVGAYSNRLVGSGMEGHELRVRTWRGGGKDEEALTAGPNEQYSWD